MILRVLLGRHGYSATPEEETALAWVYLVLGFGVGAAVFA